MTPEALAVVRHQLHEQIAAASPAELDALLDTLTEALRPRTGPFSGLMVAAIAGLRDALARHATWEDREGRAAQVRAEIERRAHERQRRLYEEESPNA